MLLPLSNDVVERQHCADGEEGEALTHHNTFVLSTYVKTDLHDIYRHLHENPELSMREERTASYIGEALRAIGLEASRVGGTGVVAVLDNGPGPVVAFRADIDGLPVHEETDLEYRSLKHALVDGSRVPVMHACGHDMHMACAIGAARWLQENRDAWAGTVVWLFQPGEETAEGANVMIADGLWDRFPRPEVIYGQHVSSGIAGTIEITSGTAMAMSDSLKVTVHGRGGHGSRPHSTIDPVVLAAHMVVRIQSIVAREIDPQRVGVISVGTFHSGLKENIVPSIAEFTLNIRSLEPQIRQHLLSAVRGVIHAEALASRAPEPVIEELNHFPLLVNDPEETEMVSRALSEAIGEGNVSWRPPQLISEDFGTLATAIGVPSVYWLFGGTEPNRFSSEAEAPSNHSSLFAPAIEPTLSTGVAAACAAILSRVAR